MKLSRLARITSLGAFAFVAASVFFALRFTGPNRRALRDRPEAHLFDFLASVQAHDASLATDHARPSP